MSHLTENGYLGFIPWLEDYILFPTEEEYLEYLKEGHA
jgi:hypothetical protein